MKYIFTHLSSVLANNITHLFIQYYPNFGIFITMFVPQCKQTQKQEPCIQCRILLVPTINQPNQLINKMKQPWNYISFKQDDETIRPQKCERFSQMLMIFENDLAHSFRVSLHLVMKLKMALSSVISKYLLVRNMELYLRFLKLNIANFVKYILIHNFLSSFNVNNRCLCYLIYERYTQNVYTNSLKYQKEEMF